MNNKENDKWGGLSLRDKAALMKIYVSSGTSSIKDMREHYNTYANGGKINIFDDGGEEGKMGMTKSLAKRSLEKKPMVKASTGQILSEMFDESVV